MSDARTAAGLQIVQAAAEALEDGKRVTLAVDGLDNGIDIAALDSNGTIATVQAKGSSKHVVALWALVGITISEPARGRMTIV